MTLLRLVPAVLVAAALLPAAAAAQSPAASPGAAAPRISADDAVALVLAQDPRFAGLPSNEEQRREAARTFTFLPQLISQVTVLPTVAGLVGQPLDVIAYDDPAPSWVIEVLLSDGCAEPAIEGSAAAPDPCAWRHTWLYRVTADGTVSLLFDEGDPEQ